MRPALDGRLEGLALRWGVPHCPEFELGLYRRLFARELRERLAGLAGARTARGLAERGRLRRLLGDPAGREDLLAALDLEPELARAHRWLGEEGLGRPEALVSLERARALDPSDGWAACYHGAGLLLAGKPRQASASLAAAARLLPREALPSFLLGLALSRSGRKEAAGRALARALSLEPSCSAAALLRGGREAAEALDAEPDHAHVALFTWEPERSWPGWLARHAAFCLESGRELPLCARFGLDETRFSPYPSEAVDRARRAVLAHGRKAWTLAVYGRALCRVPGAPPELLREGRRALDQAVRLRPGAGWTWAWRALARMGRDPKGALLDLDRALRLSPHYFRAYGWRGALLRRGGRFLESLRDLDRAAAGDERYPFSAHERSLTRRALGDLVGAALDLDRAYALDPRYSWVYAAGREPSPAERGKGLAELSRAVARHPSCVSLRAWRGELFWRAGRLSEAALALEEAAALDPAHALAQGFLGLTLLEAGRPGAAAAPLSRAVLLDGRHIGFRAGLAEALRRDGRRGDAERALADALRARPKAWTLRLQRARWRLEDERYAEALREARAAAALEGRDADGWFLEARALAGLGRAAQAEAAVDRALAIAPNLGRAYLLRAQLRQARGRSREAVADFRLVHERFPYLFNEEERGRVAALLKSS